MDLKKKKKKDLVITVVDPHVHAHTQMDSPRLSRVLNERVRTHTLLTHTPPLTSAVD